MNLFVTDKCPHQSAANLDDKRVVNQIRETAQLLCTALSGWGCEAPILMKPTHINHPVTKWVSGSLSNWLWAFEHFEALSFEKRRRWPTNPHHKNYLELSPVLCSLALKHSKNVRLARTSFQNSARNDSLGLDYSSTENVFLAYQVYLSNRWSMASAKPRWTNSNPPAWANLKVAA